ncbi:MAG: RIP metalloprotease RseP, partial [Pseudomonadota bacterium]
TIVVFFHELGHFAVARWNRVKVDAFAVGFGPELIGRTDRQGTRWKLCVIPLGGYVRFLGDANEASVPDANALDHISADEREGAFQNKSVWRRAAVVAAGPLANFILASFIYTGIFLYQGEITVPPVVGEVSTGLPAEEAGIQPGDLITSVEGKPVKNFEEVSRLTMISSDEPLRFTVDRNGENLNFVVAPRMVERTDRFGNKFKVAQVGISSRRGADTYEHRDLGPGEAFIKSIDAIGLIISRTGYFLRDIFLGKQDADQLRGPLGIGQMTSQVATLGVLSLLSLAAALSVSIGLMNLFPIPMLDGGHLVFYAYEAIRGRAASPRAQEIAYRVGLTCVLMMMIFATSNDIARLFTG